MPDIIHTHMPSATAVALAQSHAGEVLQGAIRHGERTRRLLFSLPAPTLWTKAELLATPGQPLTIDPPWARKALSAAQCLLQKLEVPYPEAVIRLTSNIPTGKGCGSSTTDILATIRVLLAYLKLTMPEEAIARLIVQVEDASDGSVLSRPALFRHREGVVEEYLPGEFPPMYVMVIDAQPHQTVNTVSMPRARYSAQQLAIFSGLIVRLKRAFRESNPYLLGSVATASARISQEFLPKPYLEEMIQRVERKGGYGLSVSHSGTIVSALLPINCDVAARADIASGVEALGMRVLTEYSLKSRGQREIAA